MKSLSICCLTALLALLGSPEAAHAELSVTYRAVHSELTLFGQKQESPFAKLQFSMQVRGPQMRTEMTDHFGRRYWFLADRASGKAIALDPESRSWWVDPSSWKCDDIPAQVARSAARLLATGGIEELVLGLPEPATRAGVDARRVEAHFRGRVLGAPQPVEATLVLYFPADEKAVFGAEGVRELYCGARPSAGAWQQAFARYLKLPVDRASALAGVAALPLEIELSTDLGMGRASVTMSAGHISRDALGDEVFALPQGFTERKP
jgi:hypothetical protein